MTPRSGILRLRIVVAVLLVSACGAGGSPAPSPTIAPTPTALLTSTPIAVVTATPVSPSPAAPTALAAKAWRAVPDQESVRGVQFLDVAWTSSRFVAVGTDLDGGGAILDSTDGLTWHRQAGLGAGASLSRVAAGRLGVVVIGTIDDRPASWWSRDGLTWTARKDAFPSHPAGTDVVSVTDVAGSSRGWFAVGREDPACNVSCGLAPVRALAWTSSDGLYWTHVAGQESLEGGGMNAVSPYATSLVAAGAASGHGAIWMSSEGLTWVRIPDEPVFHGRTGPDPSAWAAILGVAAARGVVVAVGMDGPANGGGPSVRAWWSSDGRVWAPATVDGAVPGQVFSVAPTPDGFLATGPSSVPSCRGGIWASADGRTWGCVASDPAFDGFGPYAAAASSTVEVAVGLTSVGWDQSTGKGLPGAAWWRPVQ